MAGPTQRAQPPSALDLNEYYRKLAFELDDGDKGNFLSGWQCDNPFVASLFDAVTRRRAGIDFAKYIYFDADEDLVQAVLSFHRNVDGVAPEAVLSGAGASPLMFSFITLLSKLQIRRAYYIPPVYHTVPVALARYGIEFLAAAKGQPFDHDFELNLPEASSVLFLTDPVWFAGVSVPSPIIRAVAEWQQRTGSIVFVDGSLQYLPWNGALLEETSKLTPSLTYRLVSPSKQLAIHGYRFAYLLLPEKTHPDLTWIYSNICGPASAESVAFAHEAMSAIVEGQIPSQLTQLAASRCRSLTQQKIIEPDPKPDRAFSVFAKVNCALPTGYQVMDGRYFDQERPSACIKVNLLSPSIQLLLKHLRD